MKILPLCLLAPTVAAIALPLTAQTTAASKTSTTPQTIHRTSTVPHRPIASACALPLPALSAKIPALPVGAPHCPTAEYSLTYIDTSIGTGELALPRKFYTVHYTGYLPDGTVFDSSTGKDPISFPYGAHRVITGWDTGFDGMHVGGKRRLYIPYQLAYGAAGKPPVIPEKSMLIFDVELVSQGDAPPAQKAAPAPAPAPKPAPAPAAAPKPTTAPPPPPSPAGTSAPPPITSQTPSTTVPPPTATTPKP